MLLKDKTAIIYGAGGAVGGAVARAFAREGAQVFLAGRTTEPLQIVAREIAAQGGKADIVPLTPRFETKSIVTSPTSSARADGWTFHSTP